MSIGTKVGSVIPLIGEERSTQDSPGEIFDLTNLLRMLRARWRLIASVALLLLVITTIITFTLTPRYTAEAIITLDERKNNVTDANAILSGLTGDAATVQVQIQILRSRSLLAHVIDKEHLDNDPALRPALQGESNFKSLRDSSTFKWLAALSASWFKKPVTIKTPQEEAQDVRNELIDSLFRGLTVSTAGFSQAIEIKFSSENAQQAARITNAIADAYMEDQLNAKLEATKNASKYLSDRLNELTSQVKTAEAAVTRFRAENDLMDAGQGISSVDQQINALNSQLVILQLSLAEQTAKVDRIRELQRTARDVDVTQVIDSLLINQLRTEESALLRQEAELSSKYGPRHPKMIDLQSQKVNLERKIEDEVSRIGQAASNDLDVARAKLRALQQNLDGLQKRAARRNQSLVTLKQLEQNAASSHSLYDAFLSQFKQIGDREEIQKPDARILSSAAVPKAQSFPPSKMLIFGAAIPASLFLGFMAALFSELFVSGFRTSAQLEQILALPVLATAPEVRGKRARSSVSNIVSDNPVSPFAESMRGIQFGLTNSDADHPPKVILVTSAIPQEGKSTVALSLARTVARNGKKVVLMGCDFRRPELLRMVRAGKVKKGLVEVLLGGESVENCFHKDPYSEVLLLAPEMIVRNPSDLLGSVEMENLIRDLRGSADCIIIDSPPLLPVNDTKLLIRLIDTMLLIVRWEKTPRDAAIAAVRSLVDLRAPIAGVVITRADSYNYYNYGFQNYSSYTDEVLPRGASVFFRWFSASMVFLRWLSLTLIVLARVFFRWVSLTLIVLALMLLGADIMSTLEAGSGMVVRSLDKILLLFGVDATPWVQTTFSSGVANAFLAVLSSPGWATLGIVGVVLGFIVPGRREKRKPAAPHSGSRGTPATAGHITRSAPTIAGSRDHEAEKFSPAEAITPSE